VTATDEARGFVETLAREGYERVRPSYVAEHTHADAAEAHAVLAAMAENGDLDSHFEVICNNSECHRTVARYERVDDVPLGKELECPSGHRTAVTLQNVWVYYTPSRDLLLRVNREGQGSGGDQKKGQTASPKAVLSRLISWVMRGCRTKQAMRTRKSQ
jgi:hypothetical protein